MVGGVDVRQALIAKTLRVPAADGPAGDGAAVARRLGRRAAVGRLQVLARAARAPLRPAPGGGPGAGGVRAARGPRAGRRPRPAQRLLHRLPGQRPRHGRVLGRGAWPTALQDPRSAGNVAHQLARRVVNLLDLPSYGRYQHTYEELLARARRADRPRRATGVTVLGLGRSLAEESHALYLALASEPGRRSSEADLALLGALAELHVGDAQPDAIADPREPRGGQRARASSTGSRWSSTRRSTCCGWRARSPTAT